MSKLAVAEMKYVSVLDNLCDGNVDLCNLSVFGLILLKVGVEFEYGGVCEVMANVQHPTSIYFPVKVDVALC